MKLVPATIALALLIAAGAEPGHAQAPPPNIAWQTIDTEHFRVTFAPDLGDLAQHAADRAEAAWVEMRTLVTGPPSGRIDVLLTDHVDFTNGFARTFPSNRIVIFARPPADDRELGWFDDWIDLVVTHELAHIFQIDATSGFGGLVRTVFGRVPWTWPAYPVRDTPLWSIEGLAVGVESDHSSYGRVHGAWQEMHLRTVSLADRFDPYERVSSVSPIWPGQQRVYIYGSMFLEYLEQTVGTGTTARMVEKTKSAFIPPFLSFGQVGRRTIGKSFNTAWAEWREALEARYAALADSLRSTRLTEAERVTTHGRVALFPRVSPDGTRIAYAADDGREIDATRVIELDGTRLHTWRRNGGGALAWLPDGSGVILSQLEYDGPYRIREDLWRVGPDGETRVTHNARLQDPDISRSGRIVAIQSEDGTNRPVLVSGDGTTRPLAGYRVDINWAFPRFSPDGTRIAISRWNRGTYAIVVLDTLGAVHAEIPDEGIASAPAWSPDGRHVVYSSDRTGISNLYAAEPATGDVRQVTQLVTGGFTPDVAPDGTIYYAEYAADGYHIVRLPWEPSSWRTPGPVGLPLHADARGQGGDAGNDEISGAQVTQRAVRSWSPFPTVLPHYWEPTYDDRGTAGDFFGIETSGEDLVGRNAWSASLALDARAGRTAGDLVWTWAGLGVPLLQLQAARSWDPYTTVAVDDETSIDVIERSDAAGIFAILPIQGWRRSAQISVGVSWARDSRGLLLAPPDLELRDARDDLLSGSARLSFANHRTNDLSISREDGVSASIGGRLTREIDAHPDFPRDYQEVNALLTAYKSLPLGGFARPVLAARASALRRFGDGAQPTRIGGASGSVYNLLGLLDLGDGSLFLPVRGFGSGVLAGTRAWTASAELRLPVAIPGRRLPLTPFYFDRISLSLFGDAGDASCSNLEAQLFLSCQSANAATSTLLSAGAELVTDLGIGSWFYTRVRIGLAQPIRGPDESPQLYLRFGSAF